MSLKHRTRLLLMPCPTRMICGMPSAMMRSGGDCSHQTSKSCCAATSDRRSCRRFTWGSINQGPFPFHGVENTASSYPCQGERIEATVWISLMRLNGVGRSAVCPSWQWRQSYSRSTRIRPPFELKNFSSLDVVPSLPGSHQSWCCAPLLRQSRHPYSTVGEQHPSHLADLQPKTRPQQQHEKQERKRLDVAILGMPNAGKSQLLNVLVQSNVAAVSKKRHTTRNCNILGICTSVSDGVQLVFVDTPGFIHQQKDYIDGISSSSAPQDKSSTDQKAKREAPRAVSQSAISHLYNGDHDVALVVIDSARVMTESVQETYAALMYHAAMVYTVGKLDDAAAHVPANPNEGATDGVEGDPKDRGFNNMMRRQKRKESNGHCTFPFAIVLNKVDLVNPKKKLLNLALDLSLIADAVWTKAETEIAGHGQSHSSANNLHKSNGEIQGKASGYSTGNEVEDPKQVEDEMVHGMVSHQNASEVVEGSPNVDINDNGKAISLTNSKGEISLLTRGAYCPVFMISALHDDGGIHDIIQTLIEETQQNFPSREWIVDDEKEVTESTPLQRVEEVIREKIYRSVHKEVPYNVVQINESFEYDRIGTSMAQSTKVLRISQIFVVQTKSHERILKGKNNVVIEQIADQSKKSLQEIFGCRVILTLKVKNDKQKFMRGMKTQDAGLEGENEGIIL